MTMTRQRNDQDDYYETEERWRRDPPSRDLEPYGRRRRSLGNDEEREYGRGRFGERADYQRDEPRYTDVARPGSGDYRSRFDRDYSRERFGEREPFRSRLRARDVMTRELAFAVSDNTLFQIAQMMKDEDTGVIPVIEYAAKGNGGSGERRINNGERTPNGYGKLVGLITDRDIVIRTIAEGKDPGAVRAGEIMSQDIEAAKPTDRVVDVLRKMATKQVRRIPVVSDNGHLLGMISLGDIALETDADSELADALEEISKESSFWRRIFR